MKHHTKGMYSASLSTEPHGRKGSRVRDRHAEGDSVVR